MLNLPKNMTPDASGCFCFDLADDRFAFVHTYFHTHTIVASYNRFLAELGKPALEGIQFTLARDESIPTTGSASFRGVPRIDMTFPTPAVELFTLAHEIGHLVDYRIGPRPTRLDTSETSNYRQLALPRERRRQASSLGAMSDEAQEAGVGEGTANVLAALQLGISGSPLFTADSLDAPPANDIDTFIRFPDLIIKRRQTMESLVNAPRFAARYSDFVQQIRDNLANPDLNEYLDQPDEYASSAAINQPLWNAAIRFGFDTIKRVYLRTLAGWREPEVTYLTLACQVVEQARSVSTELGAALTRDYVARGLTVDKCL